jgi:integrase/recombinase XerC
MTTALPLYVPDPHVFDIALGDRPAREDISAIVAWVASKRGSEHTRRAFGIEARRWLAWLMWVKAGQNHKTWLDKASSLDAAAYAQYLANPKEQPFPESVLERAALTRQPFKRMALQPASVERAISSLKAMYADMIEMTLEGGLQITRSPFGRFKTTTVLRKTSPRRKALTALERGYIDDAYDEMQREGRIADYHQQKWIWTALLWGALRRHELAQGVAGDIYQDVDEEGEPTWMLEVIGKGSVEATIPLASEFMDGFREYRAFHGLPVIPMADFQGKERTPLVLPMRGAPRSVHSETIYRAVKKLLGRASEIALTSGNPASAGRLKSFASHSARHTQVTMIVDKTGDITLGQEMARHGSITTTRQYKAKSVSRLVQALKDIGAKPSVPT